MATRDTLIASFAAYEDSKEYLGMTDATLPDIEYMSEKISGAGIGGEIEEIIIGHMSAMTTTLKFRTVSSAAVKLLEPRSHKIDLRVAQQQLDTSTGKTNIVTVKYILKLRPKETKIGKIESASKTDVSGSYATSYYAMYLNGKKVTEIDPLNFICLVNGKDCLSNVKKTLGLVKKKKKKKKKKSKKKKKK